MLTTKDIIDKAGYLAQLLSQPCVYAKDVKRCALLNMRGLHQGCTAAEIEIDLTLIQKTLSTHDTSDFIAQKLDEHFACAYE